MKKLGFLLLTLSFCFTSCEKDLLIDEYDQFEGKYEWVYSRYTTRDCVLCKPDNHIYFADSASYTAQIEFDDASHVTFFINDSVLVKKRYAIMDQYQDANGLFLELRVDVNKNTLDINDRLEVVSVSEDTLKVRGFPGDGYDTEFNGGNYFIRIR